jgi:hypothetical protein
MDGQDSGIEVDILNTESETLRKRKVQKRENRIFDMLPEFKITFNEFADLYKDLKQIKNLSSFRRIKVILANFNKVFGKRMAKNFKYTDLTDYQRTHALSKEPPPALSIMKYRLSRQW